MVAGTAGALPAEGQIEAVVRVQNVKLGSLLVAKDRAHDLAQPRHEAEQSRRQDATFGHVDDVVGGAGVESDRHGAVAPGDPEDGTPSRARPHGNDPGNLNLAEPMARQSANDEVALPPMILRLGKILIGASAAGAEMHTHRFGRGHDLRAARRNSRLPSLPKMGLSIVPITDHPLTDEIHWTMSASAASCASASRTIPPLPRRNGQPRIAV